ncbi:TetR/AcrR family transcriptional regulator [Liquorilactobacillus uvarum]|uniref:TetR/AcrR family transcriptional regulator n=1 Tax=Liquorilactobacillus uvarum TaxID=303240 RepID=UPI00288963C4|nr:TetR/AcrR family transcriptional regulator [Liquorilactobacillus uvarum]
MTDIRNYQETHKKLLNSGMRLFLETDFEMASVRQICKLAGVTTGAFYKHFKTKEDLIEELVEPHLIQFKKIYDKDFNDFLDETQTNNLSLEKYWRQNAGELDSFIDYMYQHQDITNLVLFKAVGSKYDNILEKVTLFSEKQTIKAIIELQKYGLIDSTVDIKTENVHFFMYSYYATVYDIFKHAYSLEKTKKIVRRLYLFFMPAWLEYLKIKK